MSATVRYAVGSWWAVVTGGDVVLLPEAVQDADLAAVHRVLAEGGGVAQLIQVLVGGWSSGLSELPPFCIALLREGEARTAVRGPITVEIEGAEPIRVDGRRASTWSEHVALSATGLVISIDTESTCSTLRWLPVRDAVVPVSGIRVQVGIDGSTGQPTKDPEPASAVPGRTAQGVTLHQMAEPDDGDLSDDGQSPGDLPDDQLPGGELPDDQLPGGELPDDQLSGGELPDDQLSGGELPDDGRLVVSDGAAVPEPAPEQSLINYDHVWDETSLRSVEDAAVRVQEEAADAPASPRPGGLVSGVPTFNTAGDGGEAQEGDHDGHTVVSAKDLATVRAGARTSGAQQAEGPTPPGPVVLSARCPQGHHNPPHAATCATCGQRVVAAPCQASRPSLGTVQLPDGTVVTLSRSVVFGRRPQATRVRKDDLPQLVTLNGSSISRTHVEVRLEDWNVLAVDLGSSNGTYLNRPGQEPVRLTAHDPLPLRSGDVLDLGDDVILTLDGVP